MGTIRALFRDRSRLALLLLGLALAAKALVPAGYMMGGSGKILTISVCADALGGGSYTKRIVVPHSGDAADDGGATSKAEGACAWSALAFAATLGADAALLALALAFILALGFAGIPQPRARRILHLRPPLRGPPARIR